jgi:hypothetical protein
MLTLTDRRAWVQAEESGSSPHFRVTRLSALLIHVGSAAIQRCLGSARRAITLVVKLRILAFQWLCQ